MTIASLSKINQAQKERLSFIDFRLHFLGSMGRNDLVSRFGIQAAAATRDISLYRAQAPKNLKYDSKAKSYIRDKSFLPLFKYSSAQALTALTQGFGDDFVVGHQTHITCEEPTLLNVPKLEILATLSRAIYQKKALKINYRSLSSGKGAREISPFALVNNGLRWHIRAFDRRHGRFADFVINRISDPAAIKNSEIEQHESKECDIQWNRIVELQIIAHPNLKFPETIEHEYDMKDGILHLNVRAAVAGYVLRRWNIDCSQDHSLTGFEFHLWLKNWRALYGVENLVLAPGYKSEE